MSPRYGADDAENSELIVVNLWEIMRASNTAALGFVDTSKPGFRSRAPSASRVSTSWMGHSPSPPRSGARRASTDPRISSSTRPAPGWTAARAMAGRRGPTEEDRRRGARDPATSPALHVEGRLAGPDGDAARAASRGRGNPRARSGANDSRLLRVPRRRRNALHVPRRRLMLPSVPRLLRASPLS